MSSNETQVLPSTLKIIGVGLARTGTLSLATALEILGFGPCWHPLTAPGDRLLFDEWAAIARGDNSGNKVNRILEGYGSTVDGPTAGAAETLYRLFPNAKFILTVRNPKKWKESMDTARNAMLGRSYPSLVEWTKQHFEEYHGGLIAKSPEDAEIAFNRHTERIKKLIDPKQLLVYEVEEGWDRLVEFLQVPRPKVPFPHENRAGSAFKGNLANLEAELDQPLV